MIDAIRRAAETLGAQFTQDTRLLRLATSLGADKLLVECIDGREALSDTWRFTITALSSDAHLDLAAPLGHPALLEWRTQDGSLRPIHGHVAAFERLSAEGGFARYRLTLEPWLAFLRHRRDSYVWQGKTVPEIIAEIFSDYQGNGMLAPAWRLALADESQYRPRELCTQFEESDLAFVERLLAEEGMFYWFEHAADPASPGFGSHTLVIADHNDAFAPNPQAEMRFHRSAAVERSDSITTWHAQRRIGTNTIHLGSWNERTASMVDTELESAHDNGELPKLACIDHPGMRRFDNRDAAERSARLQLQAHEARNKTYRGDSSVRTLAPGTTFLLSGHAIHDTARLQDGAHAATFAVTRVRHRARNNLGSAARTLIDGLFANTSPSPGTTDDEPEYHNSFTALRADITWRPWTEDGHGALLHPKPHVTGVHTAIVVGLPGEDITTDRDHRIKVQMHWQRGARSQSRRPHPQGDDNAPGHDGAHVWVRVAEAAAGPNFGSSFLPRIGQEVIVDYLEGDIDRPIIIGSLYNGRGMEDAQGNEVAQGAGPTVGNAPAWFAGNSGGHAHNAILSGFKTQETGRSKDGQGGHNALVFDDTSGQLGTRLYTTQHATQLNLGHIKRQRDNERRQSHGHGAELTTDAHGALRASQGLLVSADASPNAGSGQMDASEAHAQLKQAHALQMALAGTAQRQQAFSGAAFDKARHEQPETTLARQIESLEQTVEGIGSAEGGGAGTAPAFGRPDLVMSAPAGIALMTPQDMHASANATTVTGDIDVTATVGRNFAGAAKNGISLFTSGDANAKRKEHGEIGIKLHAAQGKVDVQAQSAALKAAADKGVHVTSTHAMVEVVAKDHVLLTAGGAYVRIGGGSIEIHAPGKVEFKAGMKEMSGPASLHTAVDSLPNPEPSVDPQMPLFSQQIDLSHMATNEEPGFNTARKRYWIVREDGKLISSGITSTEGLTNRIFSNNAGRIKVAIETGEWVLEEYLEADDNNEGAKEQSA
ncbi:MAG TPA: type VI secretion system tip protein TssI/VgrG [Noviherbaspirillum sp.]|uniref:type VI secretion system Vgr family protein n=1 Tax=Noviherbaspirillum sp. TaxID=1926288 RepID=UPI002B48C2A2|nr:type VI secretion system tip protein TssI/VgrG [Noviherbaspirillum sp.]HJV87496.1 type VI secretion system tip protein TssI/VgrG [Noviherbaspirillum sp.]